MLSLSSKLCCFIDLLFGNWLLFFGLNVKTPNLTSFDLPNKTHVFSFKQGFNCSKPYDFFVIQGCWFDWAPCYGFDGWKYGIKKGWIVEAGDMLVSSTIIVVWHMTNMVQYHRGTLPKDCWIVVPHGIAIQFVQSHFLVLPWFTIMLRVCTDFSYEKKTCSTHFPRWS